MNTERLAQIAEWLEAGGDDRKAQRYFDMRVGLAFNEMDPYCPERYVDDEHHCDIAGAAVSVFGDVAGIAETCTELSGGGWGADDACVVREAARVLALDIATARALFWPDTWLNTFTGQIERGVNIEYFNDPSWAAAVIRRLIATGKVDWEAARPDPLIVMANARKRCGKQAPRFHPYEIARERSRRPASRIRQAEMLARATMCAGMVP